MRALIALLLAAACCAIAFAAAAATSSPGAFMIDEDFFAGGAAGELDKRVDGDAYISGGRVAVRGPVKGDLVVAGGDVNIADTVGQDLYAGGGSVALTAQVVGNARISGGQVTIASRGGISGKAIVFAGSLQMSGRIGRYLLVYADNARIDGEVAGDVHITARRIEIGPDARINGKLVYRSPQPPQIEGHPTIAGGIVQSSLAWPKDEAEQLTRIAGWIALVFAVIGMLIVGMALIGMFPHYSAASGAVLWQRPWASLAMGFALVLCVPVAAVLLLVSLLGAPLGGLLLMLYPVLLMVGYVTGAIAIGDAVLARWARRRNRKVATGGRIVALLLALLVLLLLARIPFGGLLVIAVVLLLGLGAATIQAYRRYAGSGAAPAAMSME
jgi:cytoskeletal protein CcmA (bactofilin family)